MITVIIRAHPDNRNHCSQPEDVSNPESNDIIVNHGISSFTGFANVHKELRCVCYRTSKHRNGKG